MIFLWSYHLLHRWHEEPPTLPEIHNHISELVSSIWYKLQCHRWKFKNSKILNFQNSNLKTCSMPKNQSAHSYCLIRVLKKKLSLNPWLSIERPSKTQIRLHGCKLSLIWVFDGRTCQLVPFDGPRLIIGLFFNLPALLTLISALCAYIFSKCLYFLLKTVKIQISWLLMKPADQQPHCFQTDKHRIKPYFLWSYTTRHRINWKSEVYLVKTIKLWHVFF